jgi:hypothetical protein
MKLQWQVISRATAHRKWQRSMDILVAKLNGSEPTAKRKWQRRVIQS